MSITLDRLVQAQKQIQALFLRPIRLQEPRSIPPDLKEKYSKYGSLPVSQQPAAYRFGLKHLEGVAVSWPQEPRLDVWLTLQPPNDFANFLAKEFPDVPLRLVVTGRFHFLGGFGIGSDISLELSLGTGSIGLFLNGSGGTQYALTCAHVLDEDPASQPVDSVIDQIGELAFRIPISTAPLVNATAPDPQEPNQVDCALAKLDAPGQSNALSSGREVSNTAVAAQGDAVTIVNALKAVDATVITTMVDLGIPYHLGRAYFDNLIATTGESSIEPGDSGSLVINGDNAAVGMVMAIANNGRTTDHPPQKLGPIVIVCDIQKILNNLAPVTGFALSLT